METHPLLSFKTGSSLFYYSESTSPSCTYTGFCSSLSYGRVRDSKSTLRTFRLGSMSIHIIPRRQVATMSTSCRVLHCYFMSHACLCIYVNKWFQSINVFLIPSIHTCSIVSISPQIVWGAACSLPYACPSQIRLERSSDFLCQGYRFAFRDIQRKRIFRRPPCRVRWAPFSV